MMIIAIISVGVYNAYLLLIRQTKDGQVKQTAALVGKKTIEDIKGDTDGESFDVSAKTTLDLGDISLEKKDSSGEAYFEKEIHLNKDFEKTTDTNYVYTQTIKIDKAKTKDISNNEYDINLDARKISTPIENTEINKIEYSFKLTKDLGSSSKIYIKDDAHTPVELSEISEGKVVLNVYIKTEDGSGSSKIKNVSVKDSDGNLLLPVPVEKLKLENDKVNQLYLSINFDDYKKGENETLNTEINIYNFDEEKHENITNINIEKPRDLDIDVKTRKGEVNIYSDRTQSTDVVKLGTLYNIQVNIKDKDGQDLFSGYSNQNINIK